MSLRPVLQRIYEPPRQIPPALSKLPQETRELLKTIECQVSPLWAQITSASSWEDLQRLSQIISQISNRNYVDTQIYTIYRQCSEAREGSSKENLLSNLSEEDMVGIAMFQLSTLYRIEPSFQFNQEIAIQNLKDALFDQTELLLEKTLSSYIPSLREVFDRKIPPQDPLIGKLRAFCEGSVAFDSEEHLLILEELFTSLLLIFSPQNSKEMITWELCLSIDRIIHRQDFAHILHTPLLKETLDFLYTLLYLLSSSWSIQNQISKESLARAFFMGIQRELCDSLEELVDKHMTEESRAVEDLPIPTEQILSDWRTTITLIKNVQNVIVPQTEQERVTYVEELTSRTPFLFRCSPVDFYPGGFLHQRAFSPLTSFLPRDPELSTHLQSLLEELPLPKMD